jgi:hypothetical protein
MFEGIRTCLCQHRLLSKIYLHKMTVTGNLTLTDTCITVYRAMRQRYTHKDEDKYKEAMWYK